MGNADWISVGWCDLLARQTNIKIFGVLGVSKFGSAVLSTNPCNFVMEKPETFFFFCDSNLNAIALKEHAGAWA